MNTTESLIAELEEEAATTRRVLERVPEDRLAWKPHPKSMSLGTLALHLARLPRGIAQLVDDLDAELPLVPLPQASSVAEVLDALEEGVAFATAKLREWGDRGLAAQWSMTHQGATLLRMPRLAMLRAVMLNHSYHHRGQLTVYLRLLEVPLPPVYGPTADESPFG